MKKQMTKRENNNSNKIQKKNTNTKLFQKQKI